LTLLERVMPSAVRWAWAINAASSVLGSAAAIFLAIYLGIQATLIIGGVCYLTAAFSIANSALNYRRGDYAGQFAGAASAPR
jgi:hypothetical protein